MATRPTLRIIGERGPEAVVPLHRMAQMGGGGGGVNVGGVTVNMGGGVDILQSAKVAGAMVERAIIEKASMRGNIKRIARAGL